MSSAEDQGPALKKPALGTRKGISISEEALITTAPLGAENPLPLVVESRGEGLDLERWAAAHRDQLNRQLLTAGGSCSGTSV